MPADILSKRLQRRSLLKAGLLVGAAQIPAPFLIKARGEEPVKIGLNDPLTGVYAALGIPSLYVGHAMAHGNSQEDLFRVDEVVRGADVAPPVAETGCNLSWPS